MRNGIRRDKGGEQMSPFSVSQPELTSDGLDGAAQRLAIEIIDKRHEKQCGQNPPSSFTVRTFLSKVPHRVTF